MFLVINGIINFIVGWQWVLKDYYDGKMITIDPATNQMCIRDRDNTRQPDTERGKCKDHRYEINPTPERTRKGPPKEGRRRTDLRVSLFSCGRRQKKRDGFSFS